MRTSILLLAVLATTVFAQGDEVPGDSPVRRPLPLRPAGASSVFGAANANCPGASCDTVWVGHSSSGPGGAFLGVAVGGLWDFDTGIAGTDSTQGWRGHQFAYTLGSTLQPEERTFWAYDYGNQVNLGNTNLWYARDLAGRKYVKTGVVSAWHPDDMAGVKKKLNDAFEPSAVPIAGARSAWCGLRGPGDTHAIDPLTGNAINGDLYNTFGTIGPSGVVPDFPGFCSLWDQLLYKDFPSTGSGTVSFRVRTDMSNFVDPFGSGWFNPDPTSVGNFVNNPADSFMVYVGSPTENAYDTNRRWISEILDCTQPLQEVFAIGGKYPSVSPDTSISRAYAGIQPVSGVVRVVFRVKTNRVRADGVVGTATAYNSKDGAAVLDQVQVNGGTVYGFDAVGDIKAREQVGNLADPAAAWVGTGKPVSADFHIHDLASLIYEDLCGGVGSTTRHCNMIGNVLAAGSHDEAEQCTIEMRQTWESPTIDLAVRTAAPGTKNAQGIDRETALRTGICLDYDVYTGFMSFDESIFWQLGARFHGPSSIQPQSGNRTWSPTQISVIPIFNPDPLCLRGSQSGTTADDLVGIGVSIPPGAMDSLRVEISTLSQGWRFGGTNLGNTRGTYFDNIRVGFTRPIAAALLSQTLWDKFQDQFPWNESVLPGDNATFDTTTALVRTALNIVAPATAPGVVPGDSIVASAPYLGDGVTSGVRMDLVFRIDPGPGNYSVKGFRTSPLVNLDPAHPFFATYLANNGPFGTPGGHGATWDRNVWNSARMDSAEKLLYPIVSRGLGGPSAPLWMGALHEDDPNFATLGIDHNLCFLVDPNGPDESANLDCDGSPPPLYGAAQGTSKEGTKILPDGWFTPGTHVEYFLRRSLIESPGTAILLFDTTRVFPQDPAGNADLDQERWSSFDVLPDMWKSTRYGGTSLACLLVIDAADRRGSNPAIRGALDSLGYGREDGATQGWKSPGPNTDPNDPAGFVAANLGQYGSNFDQYDIRASESVEAGHPGVRFATNPGAIANKRDTSGPSAAQLATFYGFVLWSSGDLAENTIHDGIDTQESADDIALLDGFLAGATPANRRGVMLDGDGIMEDGALHSDDGTHLFPFLTDRFGANLARPDYRGVTNRNTFAMLPVAPWAHPGRVYSADFTCEDRPDVLEDLPTVDGAAQAMLYENVGPSPWTASVYRPTGPSRDYRTLIDGFDLVHLRGNWPNLGAIGSLPGTSFAQLYWLDDALSGHLQICSRRGGFAGIGDLPGMSPSRFANANLGAMPNPSFAGGRVTLRFTLAKAQDVVLRVHDVAGRVVARLPMKGVPGPNAFEWDGRVASGARAPAGVYFYMLEGIDTKASKMILLSAR